MAKEYDFKVVNMEDAEAFESEIKSLLATGYELHGSMVALQSNEGTIHYIQAVIKDTSQRPSTGFSIGR